jgi:ubiquinone/menaquinone biosynthesis C-methylase UbiE
LRQARGDKSRSKLPEKSEAQNERVYPHGPDKLRSPERRGRLEIDRVVRLCLQNANVKTLLDIGTGSAVFAEAFHEAGLEVAGVDISAAMIEAARRHVPEGHFRVAPAEALPFADGSFDTTFFGVVFHEVSDYAQSLHEAYRVTRQCTCILEWQKKQEDFGPPLEHRLTEEFVRDLSVSTGYRSFASTPLNTLVLYTLLK